MGRTPRCVCDWFSLRDHQRAFFCFFYHRTNSASGSIIREMAIKSASKVRATDFRCSLRMSAASNSEINEDFFFFILMVGVC